MNLDGFRSMFIGKISWFSLAISLPMGGDFCWSRKTIEPAHTQLFLAVLRSRSRFFCGSEPGAGAAFFKAAPAASFRQAKKKSLVLVSTMTLRAVEKGKYGPK